MKRKAEKPRKIIVRRRGDSLADDIPEPFGYKRSWVAIPAADNKELADTLDMHQLQPCSWIDGLAMAYRHEGIFITPAVGSWTLAVGSMPEASQTEFVSFVKELSRQFQRA